MRTTQAVALVLAVMLGFAAVAGEKQRTKIKIAVDGDEGAHEVHFDSDSAGFNLDDLEVGESRSFGNVDDSQATVTRTESGFEFDVDGHTIDLSELHEGSGNHGVFVSEDVADVAVFETMSPGGATIITSRVLDDVTRQMIREILQSSGEDGEIVFIDSGDIEGADTREHRKVRIITKEVDVTN